MAGQIINRGEDTYLLRVFTGRVPSTGKKTYYNETFHGSLKGARKRLNRILADQDDGKVIRKSRDALIEYLDEWLEISAKVKLSNKTFESYSQLIRLYLREEPIARIRMDKLKPQDVQAHYNALCERVSARTVRMVHNVLRSALKQAVRWQMINTNPADAVDLPKQHKAEMQALSPVEAARFLEAAASDKWYAVFAFALATGCRPGEYLALQWKDVDLRASVATIQRSITWANGAWQFIEPKTVHSRRTIPLPGSVTKALQEHRRRQAEERLAMGPAYENHDLVFASNEGTPLDAHNLTNRHFKAILKRAGLPNNFRLYDLRHSCATLLLSVGEHPKVVSERLGHSSTALTMDVYTHVLPGLQQKAAERLEGILFGSDENNREIDTHLTHKTQERHLSN